MSTEYLTGITTLRDDLLAEASSIQVKDPTLTTDGTKVAQTAEDKLTHVGNIVTKAKELDNEITNTANADANTAAIAAANANNLLYSERPCVFGVKAGYKMAFGGQTSEWGYYYSEQWIKNLLSQASGVNRSYGLSTGNMLSSAQLRFTVNPYLVNLPIPLSGSLNDHSFNYYTDHRLVYAYSGSIYSYPDLSFVILPLRNESTTTDKTVSLYARGTAYSIYRGLGIFCLKPKDSAGNETTNANRNSVADYNFTSMSTYTGNSYTSISSSITIPANTTYVFILTAAEYYYTNISSHYSQSHYLESYNLQSTFSDPDISVDQQIVKNILERKMSSIGALYTIP